MSIAANRFYVNHQVAGFPGRLMARFMSPGESKFLLLARRLARRNPPRYGFRMITLGIGAFLFVLILAGLSSTAFAKTLTRSCKGAWMVKYEIGGKTHTLTGSFTTSATGASKGAVPSPVKARRRACKAAANRAAASIREEQALNEVCRKHPNGYGRMIFLGGIGRSRNESQTHQTHSKRGRFRCIGAMLYIPAECGDGKRTYLEECDNGRNNSDTLADACRTDCRRPHCGDRVTDSGEECDKGNENHDEIPGACRTNCKRAGCGDGVLDFSESEMCDDGNTNPYDGCHRCQPCWPVKNDLMITRDAKLCRGEYHVPDTQGNGAILITGNNVTLDCRGSRLKGLSKKGIGIVVSGENVVLRGCDISGFAVGIDVRNRGAVVFDNRVCGNHVDVKRSAGDLFAVKNRCNKAGRGWKESGQPGCTSNCR